MLSATTGRVASITGRERSESMVSLLLVRRWWIFCPDRLAGDPRGGCVVAAGGVGSQERVFQMSGPRNLRGRRSGRSGDGDGRTGMDTRGGSGDPGAVDPQHPAVAVRLLVRPAGGPPGHRPVAAG